MNEHQKNIDGALHQWIIEVHISEIMRNIAKVLDMGGKEQLIKALEDGMKPRV